MKITRRACYCDAPQHSKAGRNLSAYRCNLSNILSNLTTAKPFFFSKGACHSYSNLASVFPLSHNKNILHKPLRTVSTFQFQVAGTQGLFESNTLPRRRLWSGRSALLSCLIQSAAQTSVSVLASGFCSVLVPLTQTSWHVFTFCSCFPLYPCFPSSSSSSLSLSEWACILVTTSLHPAHFV